MKTEKLPAWPILLLGGLSVIFFVGGCFLEFEAASHGVKAILKNKDGLTDDQLIKALAFQADRVSSIQQVATMALDISKVSLGALIAAISQNLIALKNTPDGN